MALFLFTQFHRLNKILRMNAIKFITKTQATLSETPLNPLDVLGFTWLTYFDMSGVQNQIPLDLHKLKDSDFYKHLERLHQTFLPSASAKIGRALIDSPRYEGAMLVGYQENYVPEKSIQFGAIAAIFADRLIVAFEGTDLSLTGWKEDFIMSYQDTIPSYPLAEEFLTKVMADYPGYKVILAGHSKGGNIAAYLLATIKDDSRIDVVYSYEGPGFHDRHIFDAHPERRAKLQRYIPQGAIVGIMLNSTEDTIVVKSPSIGVFQHNPLKWKVDKDYQFVRLKKLSWSSRYLKRTANAWIDGLTDEDKKKFTEMLFGSLGDGRGHIYEILRNIFKAFPAAHNAYKNLSKEDRKFFWKTLGKFPKKAWMVFVEWLTKKPRNAPPKKIEGCKKKNPKIGKRKKALVEPES